MAEKKSGNVIKPCACDSKFQDKAYGSGQRVHTKSGKSDNKCRCTVCGAKK